MECPCYTCLVAAMCPNKEPTPEEWKDIIKNIEADDLHWQPQIDVTNYETLDTIIRREPYQTCSYYREWVNLEVEKLRGVTNG